MSDEARETDSPNDDGGAPDPSSKAPMAPNVTADAAPPEGAVDPAAADDSSDGEGGKIDPQLIGLALVLWLLAVGIFAFKWDRLRVDWYLGNIKETGDLTGRLDEASMTSLAAMATADAEVLQMIADEVVGPLANRDEFYRSALVKTIERVPGPAAHGLLTAASTDFHGVVRANAYVSLAERAKLDPSEREPTTRTLLAAVAGEGEPMARAFALSVLGDLGVKEALWPTIRAVRDARGAPGSANAEAAEAGERTLREMGAKTFYALSGTTPEQLPFDPKGELAARDEQVRAWERWFVANGGTIPDGERFEDVYPADGAAQGPPTTSPSTQEERPAETSTSEGSRGDGSRSDGSRAEGPQGADQQGSQ